MKLWFKSLFSSLIKRQLKKTVLDEDGRECVFDYLSDAVKCLNNVNEMKKLNPQHANDIIVLRNVETPFYLNK